MYSFLLWTKSGRQAVARAEMEPHRQAALAEGGFTAQRRAIINRCFDEGLAVVEHNIHPLCLLGLRPKITTTDVRTSVPSTRKSTP